MLSIRRILHPTDFSKHSEFALRLAVSLAREYGAELVLAHVDEPPLPIATEGMLITPTLIDLETVRARLDEVHVDDSVIPVRRVLVEGDPATEILQLADDTKCDLIVMGTHGRTGLLRLIMGSVAEQIVRRAKCPVLTVKNPPKSTEFTESIEVAAALTSADA
jgi:nucleotide-binding universal stress UspA family protein